MSTSIITVADVYGAHEEKDEAYVSSGHLLRQGSSPLKFDSARGLLFAPFGSPGWISNMTDILVTACSKLLGVQLMCNGSRKYRNGASSKERDGLIKPTTF